MAKRSRIVIGTSGVYRVASQLAQQGFHAAVTFGNAPDAFDKPYFKSGTTMRWRWHPGLEEIEEYNNRWDTLHNRLLIADR